MTLHVRYRFFYISLSSSAEQQREMTKFKVLCRTWTHDSDCLFSTWTVTPSLQSQLPDCSATLDRLNELKLSRKSLKYLEVMFKVTFSLALPSWLFKLPIIKTTSKCSVYFDVLATKQWQKMILCLKLARMNLCLRCENVEYGLTISTDRCWSELLEHLLSNFELILLAFIFELQPRFIYGLQKELSEVTSTLSCSPCFFSGVFSFLLKNSLIL